MSIGLIHTKLFERDNNDDFVTCKICGQDMKWINWAHLKRHNMTQTQYEEIYPGELCIRKKTLLLKSEIRKKLIKEDKSVLKNILNNLCKKGEKKKFKPKSRLMKKRNSITLKNREFSDETKRKMGESKSKYLREHPEEHPNWKGGISKQIENCLDCGKILSDYRAIRCKDCDGKQMQTKMGNKTHKYTSEEVGGKNNPNYKDGRSLKDNFCEDCGIKIKSWKAKRCRKCCFKERKKVYGR